MKIARTHLCCHGSWPLKLLKLTLSKWFWKISYKLCVHHFLQYPGKMFLLLSMLLTAFLYFGCIILFLQCVSVFGSFLFSSLHYMHDLTLRTTGLGLIGNTACFFLIKNDRKWQICSPKVVTCNIHNKTQCLSVLSGLQQSHNREYKQKNKTSNWNRC